MASRCALVIRGIKTPLLVEDTSSSDEELGATVPMPAAPVVGKVFVCENAFSNTRRMLKARNSFTASGVVFMVRFYK